MFIIPGQFSCSYDSGNQAPSIFCLCSSIYGPQGLQAGLPQGDKKEQAWAGILYRTQPKSGMCYICSPPLPSTESSHSYLQGGSWIEISNLNRKHRKKHFVKKPPVYLLSYNKYKSIKYFSLLIKFGSKQSNKTATKKERKDKQ